MNATVTPAERAARTGRVRRAATRAAARYASIGHLIFAAAFWVVFGLVAVVVPLLFDRAGEQMDGGVLYATGYSARWVAFSLAIGTTYNLAAVHLAAGGTRRSLFRGVVVGSGVAGVAYGLLYGVALLGERALFTGLGWSWEAPVGYATGSTGVLGTAVLGALGEGIAVAGYALTGAAVAASFLGVRVLRTVVAAVFVGLLTLATVETVTRTGTGGHSLGVWVVEHWLPDGAAGVVVGVLAGLAVLTLATGWLWLRLRHLQLRPPT
ncbi:hypothetical protein Xcel_3321 [Xylanimonas cellulosilytica DSM 15894]|uniref:Uncharacterized protein n=1 Tax=Xylanimonas cellulosilytica (strain DSM 15894 / JCM 12276 / CECT 5975 / KCTC 9989 / LMG 20990 / NBRC 107835 / XIL07) TaxID=446471 RepID=D1BRQ5_XYLCX|nr:hypothetical protein [Xylanimonas cellulosilytica]ACZ32321.1 hypothetical protein Xcel_3321 [Xylanimonas cellulosilytica DSM 15894]